MKKLSLTNLEAFFAEIAKKEALYIPTENKGGQAQFQRWEMGMQLSEDHNTVRSAKDFFFRLFKFIFFPNAMIFL